jgi:hypothetical protein
LNYHFNKHYYQKSLSKMSCVCDCPVWMAIVGVCCCLSVCCNECQREREQYSPSTTQPTSPIAKQPGEPAEATCSDATVSEQKGNPLEATVTDATVSVTTDEPTSACSDPTEQPRQPVQECTLNEEDTCK